MSNLKVSTMTNLDGSVLSEGQDSNMTRDGQVWVPVMDTSEAANTNARNKYMTFAGLREAMVIRELVANLPDAVYLPDGTIAYAIDGCKTGETIGTGCPVYCDNGQWLTFYDNTPVTN